MGPDNALLDIEQSLKGQGVDTSADSYSVKIRKLVIEMFIGIHPHEKVSRQRVAVDVSLQLDYPQDGFGNSIYRKVACYEYLIQEIKKLSQEGHVILVETFAEKIADIALMDKRVASVSVHVEKLDIYEDCEGVGAIIGKSRVQSP
ncbi:MAG: dihydroneopterin aldolase [Rhodospirillaceae bacterium]|nr:dihydroneopterin aldolase [Rhodospirillaceae bacterium]|tara:strand:- start:89 stop:526 length:438 start_codon:yes stop_codon:yes gene_type:complete